MSRCICGKATAHGFSLIAASLEPPAVHWMSLKHFKHKPHTLYLHPQAFTYSCTVSIRFVTYTLPWEHSLSLEGSATLLIFSMPKIVFYQNYSKTVSSCSYCRGCPCHRCTECWSRIRLKRATPMMLWHSPQGKGGFDLTFHTVKGGGQQAWGHISSLQANFATHGQANMVPVWVWFCT